MALTAEDTLRLSTREVKTLFPDAAKARKLLKQHPGEAFCEFSHTGIVVGTISDDQEPISFVANGRRGSEYYSAYAEIKTLGGVVCSLTSSGRSGRPFSYKEANTSIPEQSFVDEYSLYLGSYKPDVVLGEQLVNGPPAVFESQRIEAAKTLQKMYGTRLAIGDKACGAYALGMALAELEVGPRNMDISTGLLIAGMLERSSVPWKPGGFERKNTTEAIQTLQEAFVDNAVRKLVLAELALGGRFDTVRGSVGRRISIFSYDHVELCERLLNSLHESSDERVLSDLYQIGLECEPRGDSESYLRTAIKNILSNQLGIE